MSRYELMTVGFSFLTVLIIFSFVILDLNKRLSNMERLSGERYDSLLKEIKHVFDDVILLKSRVDDAQSVSKLQRGHTYSPSKDVDAIMSGRVEDVFD